MILSWLPDVLRAAGLTVVEVPGWEARTTRSTGLTVKGVVCHHTASSPRASDDAVVRLLRDGRSNLKGPLSQLGLDRQGRFWVVAGGRCNHNGFGTWGNDSVGIEAFNDGVGERWPAVQLDAYKRGVAAILAHCGLDAGHCKGHRETDPGRKVDPTGVDMDAFRLDVADLIEGDDMPSLDEIRQVVREELATANEAQYGRIRTLVTRLRDSLATLIRSKFPAA